METRRGSSVEIHLKFFILINVLFRAWQSRNKKRQKGMTKFCLLIF